MFPAPPGFRGLLDRAVSGEGLTSLERDQLTRDAAANPLFGLLASTIGAPVWTPEEGIGLLRRAACFSPTCVLEADGFPVEASVRVEELWHVYLPLSFALTSRPVDTATRRTLVGIAGPPGSGKSVFAALLKAIMNRITQRPSDGAVVVPLDGFHFPNAYLDTHCMPRADGTGQSLRLRKGAPETFDVAGFGRALELLSAEPRVELPVYDRRTHDPVEGAIVVMPHHRVALVEGNYLLLQREGWASLARWLDLSLFLSMPMAAVRPGLIERHVRGGRTRADAERHFERVDRANYEVCTRSAGRADLIIERDADQHIRAVARGVCSGNS